ncbi:GDSL esterase/lipase [Rhynchospora pubera]|uniref:GDSL esterase/lipase n=1 Tax=Rhynchospora pubera TaxID=906938 RepID=A0AAV8H1J7_9POAL|nr:GDSL esterase/lipase [Rhynchospora pubera]
MMTQSLLQWLLFIHILLVNMTLPCVAKVPAVIIFGDSTVDTGNNNYIQTLAKSNFKPYGRDLQGGNSTGRFSNGRLAVDFISEAFGLPKLVPAYLDPSYEMKEFSTGVCFASAATGYDNATSDVFSVIPLWKEVDYFKEYQTKLKDFQGETLAHETLTQALYIISIGTNDFIENYYTMPSGRSTEYNVPEYEDFIVGIAKQFLTSLYNLGARKINLTGLPPMGCLPLERSKRLLSLGNCNDDYNKVASDFNVKLKGMMDVLNRDLVNVTIVYGDIYGILMDVIQNPGIYGFEDVAVGCCGTGVIEMSYLCNSRSLSCSDADKYAFWDSIHPTEKLNKVIADKMMNTTLHVFL